MMVQRSRFWDGTSVGDATVAPYDAGTEFAEVMIGVAGMSSDPNKGGVLTTLSVTVFTPGTIRVGPFEALVYGTWYQNDANTDFVIATPAAATRIDTLVLRKSWASQTVRLLVLSGVEGGSAPPLVQTVGVTWDIPVATISTTTGGVNTITPDSTRADLWYRTSANSIRTDSNAGVGVTPPAWGPTVRAIHVGQTGALSAPVTGAGPSLTDNQYFDGAASRALITAAASSFAQQAGTFQWYNAPSVSAGSAQAFVERMRLSLGGSLGIRTTPQVWHTAYPSLQIGTTTALWNDNSVTTQLGNNTFHDGAGNKAIVAAAAFVVALGANTLAMYGAPSVAAGAAQSFVQKLSIDGNGTCRFTSTTGTPNIHWGPGDVGRIDIAASGNPCVAALGAQNLELYGNGGYVHPSIDGLINLGAASKRWATVFASTGTINTSSRHAKNDLGVIDPEDALLEVLRVPVHKFTYKVVPNPRARQRKSDPYTTSERVGIFAEEAANPDGGNALLLVGNDSVDPQNTASVALAAIKGLAAQVEFLVRRLEALEGRVN